MTGAIGPWGFQDGNPSFGNPSKMIEVAPQKKSIPTSNNKKWMMNSQKKNGTSQIFGIHHFCTANRDVWVSISISRDRLPRKILGGGWGLRDFASTTGCILCFAGVLCVMSDEQMSNWLTIFPTKGPANEQSVGGGSHQPVYFLCGLRNCSFCRPAVNCDSFVGEVLFSEAGCAFVSPWWGHGSNCSAQDSSFEKNIVGHQYIRDFDTCLHVKSLTTTLLLLENLYKLAGTSNQFRLLFR